MKKVLIFTIVILLVATVLTGAIGTASAATTSQQLAVTGVSWFSTNSTQQAVPGMNEIPLFVTFTTLTAVQNLTVRLNLTAYSPGTFSYSHIKGVNSNVNEVYFLGDLPGGYTETIEQTVNISATASNGIYSENLSYSYGSFTAPTPANYTFNLPLSGSVSVVSPTALFGTESSPLIGAPGMSNVPLTVILENTGNSPATNVTVSYTPAGMIYGPEQHTVISAMPAYSAIPVTFLASVMQNASVNPVYSQNMTVSYYGQSHLVQFTVPVTGSSNLSLINYYTNPPVVYQDQKYVTLTIVTENSGSSFAKNVNVSVSSPKFSVMTNSYRLSYFPSGKVLNFTFLLNAANYTGSTAVTVHLGKNSINLPFYIHSYGSYAVKSTLPAFHTGASKQVLSFNITNTGSITLYDFSIHLLSPSIISIHIPSSNPLAALTASNETFAAIKPGQTITATFEVDTSSSASFGTYPAQLAISWMLNDTATHFYKTYNFNEKIQPTGVQNIRGQLTFTPLNIGVLILIIALIIGLVALGRRGSRLKKEAEKLRGQNKREEYKQLPHKEGNGTDTNQGGNNRSTGDDWKER